MKKNFLYFTAVVLSVSLGSCKKDLEVNPQDRITLDNYYKTQVDAFTGLVAI